MEVSEGNLQELAAHLQRTLSTDPLERRGAERFLESIETNQNYSVLLLNVIDKNDVPIHLRISASVTFKNFIKRNWAKTEDGGDKIHANDRVIIKENIVNLMLKSPDKIQKQLSDAINCIGKEDFPHNWPNLLESMTEKFQQNDINVIVGILHTGHSIFKRYRHEFKSDKLWREIKFVLDTFATPFSELTARMIEFAQTNANNAESLKMVYNSLVLICKIFFSLNVQDLPEFFEDNMTTWMGHFHFLLSNDPQLLVTEDKDEPGVIELVKTQVCESLAMYAQQYGEEFAPHVPGFVNDIWHLLINTGVQAKYDLLVSNAIQFLASVVERSAYKKLFEVPGTLSSICEKIIVPNMEFRDADEEAFEENADEYIKRDIEGSDVDTRRRAACDLVKALSKSFEEMVIQNFSVYIQHMLQLYRQDPKQYWKSKDAAIYLVTSLAAKGQTQRHGVTQTSQLVNVVEFFNSHIAPELHTSDANDNPVIKADAIKYTMVFRTQLPKPALLTALPSLINHLQSTSQVVHSYAACCIEKLLSMKPPQITRADLSPHRNNLIMNLFKAMQIQGSEENEYIMKALMRSLHELNDEILPFLEVIVPQLLEKLNAVSKNPSKPNFNHFLFETLCVTINVSCKVNPQIVVNFEQPLFPIFQNILQQEVQEFVPYIFQVLSLMLEKHTNGITDPYKALFPLLLQPSMWEKVGNVPALARLIQAYVIIGRADPMISEKVPGLLGIFQKLLASRTNDQFGLQLLCSITANLPQAVLSQHINGVFNLLFTKIMLNKTTKYVRCLIAFFSLFIIKRSTTSFVEIIEEVQPGMFAMVVEKLLIPDAPSVNVGDRKLCAVALTKLLCEPVFLKDDKLSKLWVPLFVSLIKLLECPTTTGTSSTDDGLEGIVNKTSEEFQTAYSHLVYTGKAEVDYCPDVSNTKINLAKSLQHLCASSPDVRSKLTTLDADAQNCLQRYLTEAGVVIR